MTQIESKKDEVEKGIFKVFRVKKTGEMTKEQMIKTGYKNPRHDKYLCYFFDEEVSIGSLNIEKIIEDDKQAFKDKNRNEHVPPQYPEGKPIYIKGETLKEYRL